jgi:hypothetical protein
LLLLCYIIWRVRRDNRLLTEKNRRLFEQIEQREQAKQEQQRYWQAQPEESLTPEQQLYRRLCTLMTEQQPYTDEHLNRDSLARLLNTNAKYVEQAILLPLSASNPVSPAAPPLPASSEIPTACRVASIAKLPDKNSNIPDLRHIFPPVRRLFHWFFVILHQICEIVQFINKKQKSYEKNYIICSCMLRAGMRIYVHFV